MTKKLPLCKCGCGSIVERKTKKYFADHYKNPPVKVVLSKEVINTTTDFAEESIVERLIQEMNAAPKVAVKVKKAKKKIAPAVKEYTKEEKRQQFLRNLRNNKFSNYYSK